MIIIIIHVVFVIAHSNLQVSRTKKGNKTERSRTTPQSSLRSGGVLQTPSHGNGSTRVTAVLPFLQDFLPRHDASLRKKSTLETRGERKKRKYQRKTLPRSPKPSLVIHWLITLCKPLYLLLDQPPALGPAERLRAFPRRFGSLWVLLFLLARQILLSDLPWC